MTLENNKDGAPELQISSGSDIHSSSTSIDAVTEDFTNMGVTIDSICASCGKEGNSYDMNICNKCKEVKYCNAACKKKHRSKHKKACDRRVAELYEEALFKDHPPNEECPLCLLPLSYESNRSNFMSCCGKVICDGCSYATMISIGMTSEGKDLCAFCRIPDATTNKEHIRRLKKLMEKGNAEALNHFAGCYSQGLGVSQDDSKANELWLKAGELGYAAGYYNLGCSYMHGDGVGVDMNKVKHYWELAVRGGNVLARHNLGVTEHETGNQQRAYKHWLIAARAGDKQSIDMVKNGFVDGFITKAEFANTLRAYHDRQKETMSDMRDKAALAKMLR